MKRVKMTIMTTAILLGVGGAIVTRANTDCTFSTQYWYNGSTYIAAGTFGIDFWCGTGVGTCSYTIVGGQYTACRAGTFLNAHTTQVKNPVKK